DGVAGDRLRDEAAADAARKTQVTLHTPTEVWSGRKCPNSTDLDVPSRNFSDPRLGIIRAAGRPNDPAVPTGGVLDGRTSSGGGSGDGGRNGYRVRGYGGRGIAGGVGSAIRIAWLARAFGRDDRGVTMGALPAGQRPRRGSTLLRLVHLDGSDD